MRIQAFRAFFARTIGQSVGAARRAGLAISRRVRKTLESIELAVGVGDDESSFGRTGSRAWFELVDEARRRLLDLFEKSGFDRYFPRFEKFLRRVLGRPAGPRKAAPPIPPPASERKTVVKIAAKRPEDAEAERLRAEVRRTMMLTHQRESAGLREDMARRREGAGGGEADPPPEE